jgi:diguanylate cyclase
MSALIDGTDNGKGKCTHSLRPINVSERELIKVNFMDLLHLQLLAATLLGLFLFALLLSAVLNSVLAPLRHKNTRPLDIRDTILQNCEGRYRAIMENIPIILTIIDAHGNFVFSDGHGLVNLEQVYADDRIGHSVFELYHDKPEIVADAKRALAGETFMTQNDAGDRSFESHMTPIRDARGQITGIISLSIDITERVRAERALRYQACYDPVTGLPNQNLLRERFVQALQAAGPSQMALIVMDLNRFREINDTFGHRHGNLVLREVGQRLSDALGPTATVARTDGDEFVVLLPGADEEKTHVALAAICTVFEQPFIIQEFPLNVEAGIGVALSSVPQLDFLLLLRHADVAMYVAKSKRKAYVFYQPELDPYTPRRLNILGALRTAIANGELTLFYQPQVDLQTGITHSVEALVRWNHPEYGRIPPDQFIPLAEQTGLIKPLTIWVLEAAIRQGVDWLQRGIQLSISVNLSAWDLRENDLPDKIAAMLERYGLPARYLCVEVTESAMITEIDHAVEILKRICNMGIKVAVDDFGTGYSSLAYLKHLPIHELKIDCLFVKEMLHNRFDATIVHSTVTMGLELGLRVVAEGIEDLETANQLTSYGCEFAQGYYWSRPVPALELEHWLQETRAVIVV